MDNKTAKGLVARLTEAGLSPKTIVEIVGVLKAVLASAVNNDGKQMFPREWNHEYIDLPVVDPKKNQIHRNLPEPSQIEGNKQVLIKPRESDSPSIFSPHLPSAAIHRNLRDTGMALHE